MLIIAYIHTLTLYIYLSALAENIIAEKYSPIQLLHANANENDDCLNLFDGQQCAYINSLFEKERTILIHQMKNLEEELKFLKMTFQQTTHEPTSNRNHKMVDRKRQPRRLQTTSDHMLINYNNRDNFQQKKNHSFNWDMNNKEVIIRKNKRFLTFHT